MGGLDPTTKIEEYEVRPPKQYFAQAPPPGTPKEMKGLAWAGKFRGNNTAPQFIANIVYAPPEEAKNFTAEQRLEKRLTAVKNTLTDWTQTASEHGEINGLQFARAYWTGTKTDKNWKMHGFIYVAKDGSNFIFLSSQDVEPNHERALKLAETAALTFRKR